MSNCECSCQPSGSCDCSSTGPMLALPCSGGSNVGQIANSAGVELDKQGRARIYCLIGVTAHISGMVDSAKSASGVTAIDGCPVACARQALEHIGIPISQHIIVTELGIEKNHDFTWTDGQVGKALEAVQISISA